MNANPNPTLLIVDDSRMSRMLMRALVSEARPNWQMQEAESGDKALEMIEAAQPDFVSMDVNMPGISGLEAAGRVRMRHPDIRIVMCTANIQESTREAAARAGLHFVAKPITPKSIADAIDFFEQ